MEILKKGVAVPREFWVGAELTCPSCNCTFKLEASDGMPKRVPGMFGGGEHYLNCPFCGSYMQFPISALKRRF